MDWLGLIGAAVGGVSSLLGASRAADAARDVARGGKKTAAANRKLVETAVSENLGDYTTALAASMDELRGGEAGAIGDLQGASDRFDPWYSAGTKSLSQLTDAMNLNGQEGYDRAVGNFQRSPGYQFALEQGIKAQEAGAAARGGVYSGAQGKALSDYGRNMQNQEWANYLGRLSGLSETGRAAAGSQGQLSTSMGNTRYKGGAARADTLLGMSNAMGNTRMAGADMLAGTNNAAQSARNVGTAGVANAWNSGLNNLAQSALFGTGRNS